MSYVHKRRESHEKSMGSYVKFVWNDAISLAQLLDEEVGAPISRKLYESIDPKLISEFERKHHDSIAELIQKTEGQRPAFIKRFTKGLTEKQAERTSTVLLVLAIIGCMRVKEVLELRNNYRYVLVPGSGNLYYYRRALLICRGNEKHL